MSSMRYYRILLAALVFILVGAAALFFGPEQVKEAATIATNAVGALLVILFVRSDRNNHK